MILLSLPSWGVWIEKEDMEISLENVGHSPHGECGLKTQNAHSQCVQAPRHSPHGECGLKRQPPHTTSRNVGASLPSWGVWIEKSDFTTLLYGYDVTPLMGSVD